jgi:hypothetical protein
MSGAPPGYNPESTLPLPSGGGPDIVVVRGGGFDDFTGGGKADDTVLTSGTVPNDGPNDGPNPVLRYDIVKKQYMLVVTKSDGSKYAIYDTNLSEVKSRAGQVIANSYTPGSGAPLPVSGATIPTIDSVYSNNNARNRGKKYYDEDGKRDIEENREGKESDDEVLVKVGRRLLAENAAASDAAPPSLPPAAATDTEDERATKIRSALKDLWSPEVIEQAIKSPLSKSNSAETVIKAMKNRKNYENAALAAAPKPRKGGKKTRKQKSRKNRRNTNKK